MQSIANRLEIIEDKLGDSMKYNAGGNALGDFNAQSSGGKSQPTASYAKDEA